MSSAIIRTGSHQFRVAEGDVIRVEKLAGDAGSEIKIDDVLMINGKAGKPTVKGASVTAQILEQGRNPKVIIFKKKRRQTYRRKNGHRQDVTVLKITKIQDAA